MSMPWARVSSVGRSLAVADRHQPSSVKPVALAAAGDKQSTECHQMGTRPMARWPLPSSIETHRPAMVHAVGGSAAGLRRQPAGWSPGHLARLGDAGAAAVGDGELVTTPSRPTRPLWYLSLGRCWGRSSGPSSVSARCSTSAESRPANWSPILSITSAGSASITLSRVVRRVRSSHHGTSSTSSHGWRRWQPRATPPARLDRRRRRSRPRGQDSGPGR